MMIIDFFLRSHIENNIYDKSKDDCIENNNDLKSFVSSVNNLEDKLRIPYSLYISGYKIKDIAKKLNISVITVAIRIYKAGKSIE